METTYSSKAAARRGAFRQKMNPSEFSVEEVDGRWMIAQTIAKMPLINKPSPVEPASEPTSEPAPSVETKVPQVKSTKPKTSKKRQRISTTDSPVAFIWHWLAQDDNAKLTRADAIAALVKLGCAPGTASTQRQRFLNASDAERVARAAKVSA